MIGALGGEGARLALGVLPHSGVPGLLAVAGDLGDAAGEGHLDLHLVVVLEGGGVHIEGEVVVLVGDRPQNIGFDGYIRDLGRAGVPAVAALDADLDVVIVEDILDVVGVAFGLRSGAIPPS